MTPKSIQQLQYYIGKVASIVTTSMNRSFDEQIAREHFVIRVQTINFDGIWGTHPYNDELVSFFALPHVISIQQEIELDPKNPSHAKMIEEFENKTGKKLEGDLSKPAKANSLDDMLAVIDVNEPPVSNDSDTGDATFVDISSLESLAEQSKRTFDAQDYLTKNR